ncbi:MAG TPA: ferredoxin [Spirochaetota bacterium]|nr:ferredoxin [Spirochaetota bacterium]HRZ25337.1 ferredoxin [Spirochaetota bacterium]HSA16044.1 ferredoxin [Spirochaetota bacterium]
MAREIFIDTAECTGCELCADRLPEVFEITREGFSRVHNDSGADTRRIQDVIDNCPAECIHWK